MLIFKRNRINIRARFFLDMGTVQKEKGKIEKQVFTETSLSLVLMG